MRRMIFVCSGNICRSPMAAGLATVQLKARNVPAAVISCGTLNLLNRPADPYAVAAMAERGIDISGHRSQGVSVGLLRMADDIVVMAPSHEAFIVKQAPELARKIVRIWEFSDQDLGEITDPIGQDQAAFESCRDTLETCIRAWLG